MKISELQSKLEWLKKKHGDIDVCLIDNNYTEFPDIGDVSHGYLYANEGFVNTLHHKKTVVHDNFLIKEVVSITRVLENYYDDEHE